MKGSLAAGVGLTLAGPFSRVRGANDDIRVAVVGINGRGGWHIGGFGQMGGGGGAGGGGGCREGKDVYVEKPCSHNVFEGRKCVEAAEKYKRIVQHGTQGRASGSWAKQVAAIASGKYGKLLVSRAWASQNGHGA